MHEELHTYSRGKSKILSHITDLLVDLQSTKYLLLHLPIINTIHRSFIVILHLKDEWPERGCGPAQKMELRGEQGERDKIEVELEQEEGRKPSQGLDGDPWLGRWIQKGRGQRTLWLQVAIHQCHFTTFSDQEHLFQKRE